MSFGSLVIFSICLIEITINMNLKYSFKSENIWLLMPDGIRLSASLAIPIAKYPNEKFPVLLEYKPYRKDDSFYNYHQPQIYYLAQRGYIVS